MSFIPNEWKEIYTPLKAIGAGGLSKVYLVKDNKTKNKYALKAYKESAVSFCRDNSYLVEQLYNVNHSFMRYYDVISKCGLKFIIMEYIRGVSLDYMKIILSEEEILKHAKRLLTQLYTLERKGLIHLDVKPRNIMVSETRTTLIDYDFLSEYKPHDLKRGTYVYLAPERIKHLCGEIGDIGLDKADIWSLGLSILTTLFPLDSNIKIKYYKDIPTIIYPHLKNIEKIENNVLKSLLHNMLEIEYSKRKRVKNLLKIYFNNEIIENGSCVTVISNSEIKQYNT